MTCICIRRKRMSIVKIEIVTGEKKKVMKNVVGSIEKRGKWFSRGSLIERGGLSREPKIFDLHPPPRSKTISDRMTTLFLGLHHW